MPRSFVFVLVLLSISLCGNVGLGWRVQQLQTPAPPPVKVGTIVQPFTTTDLSGRSKSISFESGQTLIYYIGPECGWCKDNAASFDALLRLIGNKMRIIVLSQKAEKWTECSTITHLPTSILVVNSTKIIKNLDLTSTPQTFIINDQGRVEHHWYGVYIGDTRTQIEKTLNLQLPGAG